MNLLQGNEHNKAYCVYEHVYMYGMQYMQGVPGGMCQTSGGCSL